MSNKTDSFPTQGFVFWPVGNGDSTTICIADGVTMQVDLRNLEVAEDDDDPRAPIVDRLEELLPKVDDKPYLSVFVLTHPDEDHCLGFQELNKRVLIGELWFTPRIFREYGRDLCDDAQAFRREAKRRVAKTISEGGDVGSGDRVRIIGYDDLLSEDEYRGFPRDQLTVPGNEVTRLDGGDYTGIFRAFIHAPFKDDSAGERNETSVSMQVRLYRESAFAKLLLFGDLSYPTIRKIFDVTADADNLAWNVMLSAHHCSKSVMYWQGPEDTEEVLKRDILDDMEGAAGSPGYIVASSDPVPASNKPGDNPPHAKAKRRYEEIAPDGFLCTQEWPNRDHPEPMVFVLREDGLILLSEDEDREEHADKIAQAVAAARGSNTPPQERVGFGRES